VLLLNECLLLFISLSTQCGNFWIHPRTIFFVDSSLALGPTQPPIQWVPADLFPGVERPGRESEDSSLFSAEVKNACSHTSTSPYVFMACCLIKQWVRVHDMVPS
jgi:hypothetical protein